MKAPPLLLLQHQPPILQITPNQHSTHSLLHSSHSTGIQLRKNPLWPKPDQPNQNSIAFNGLSPSFQPSLENTFWCSVTNHPINDLQRQPLSPITMHHITTLYLLQRIATTAKILPHTLLLDPIQLRTSLQYFGLIVAISHQNRFTSVSLCNRSIYPQPAVIIPAP